jgi:hypothetical protein
VWSNVGAGCADCEPDRNRGEQCLVEAHGEDSRVKMGREKVGQRQVKPTDLERQLVALE